jgi:hypothetical protein
MRENPPCRSHLAEPQYSFHRSRIIGVEPDDLVIPSLIRRGDEAFVSLDTRLYVFVRWVLFRPATDDGIGLRGAAAVLALSLRARLRSALIRVCQPSPVSR